MAQDDLENFGAYRKSRELFYFVVEDIAILTASDRRLHENSIPRPSSLVTPNPMEKRPAEFQNIRSEGGLLPPDLLRRVVDPEGKVPGFEPSAYGLLAGERINEAINQSWNGLRRHWAEFRAAVHLSSLVRRPHRPDQRRMVAAARTRLRFSRHHRRADH